MFVAGLRDLLAYEESDIEEVFSLNFTIVEENYGEKKEIELKPDGAKVSVNQVLRWNYSGSE